MDEYLIKCCDDCEEETSDLIDGQSEMCREITQFHFDAALED